MKNNNPYKIIDVHTHIFPEKIAEKAIENIGNYYHLKMWGKGTVNELLKSGGKIGVEKYVVHSSATRAAQVRSINRFVADTVKSHDNLIGFGTLHADLKDIEKELETVISLGLKGIKLHPEFQHFQVDNPTMFPIYRAVEGKLPVLMHMGDENDDNSSPERLARILDKFPDLIVIAAHFGGYSMWDASLRYLIGSKVYMDTCSSLAFLEPQKAVDMIRRHGTDKFLFGTDYPMWDHANELERFMKLNLNEEERMRILYDNAVRLFNLNEPA